MYRLLAERYGFGPNVVANLTNEQLCMYLRDPSERVNPRTGRRTRTFASMAEVAEYQRQLAAGGV